MLLNADADKKAKQIDGATALLIAAEKGCTQCLQLLPDTGADKNATTDRNSTALMLAAWNGHLECIKYLLNCDINAVNNNGHSTLSASVAENHVDCVRTLVRADADITIEVDGRSIAEIADNTNNGDALRTALLFSTEKQRICEECERMTRGKMFKCGACTLVYYCHHECQKAHWQQHKLVCIADWPLRKLACNAGE
jgi:ankyrin repeat protein